MNSGDKSITLNNETNNSKNSSTEEIFPFPIQSETPRDFIKIEDSNTSSTKKHL